MLKQINFFCGARVSRIHHVNTQNFLLCLAVCPYLCTRHLLGFEIHSFPKVVIIPQKS